MIVLFLAWVTAFGLVWGSFTNVLIARLPAGQSIVRPRSACPKCGHLIRAWDNIPVLSWLLLGGRCRDCKTPISAQYPLVEMSVAAGFVLPVAVWPTSPWLWALVWVGWTTAVAAAGIAWARASRRGAPWTAAVADVGRLLSPHRVLTLALVVGAVLAGTAWAWDDPALWPAVWVTAAAGVVLTVVDATWQRLPFAVSVPAVLVTTVLLMVPAAAHHQWHRWVLAVVCAGVVLAGFLVMGLIYPAGMGGGDVVLAPFIGLLLGWLGGWPMVGVGLFTAALAGALVGLGTAVRRRGRHASPGVPFGPFLFLGVLVAALVGPQIAAWYATFLP